MKTKIDIISGFLGAGKTMLIKKLLNEKIHSENTVIIENEFGEIGIDGSVLRQSSINVTEINAGCICCSIAGDFKKAIIEVMEKYKPERIIIEPSGVGKLSDVLGVIKNVELKNQFSINMIITVIDVLKFDLYLMNFGEFYRNQIENADTLILSRTQNISGDKMGKAVSKIQQINSRANIITTPWDKISGQNILEVAQHDTKQDLMEKVNLLKRSEGNIKGRMEWKKNAVCHQANDIFTTWSTETPKKFSEVSLRNILTTFSNSEMYGSILRAKGILQESENRWIQFDYVPGEFQVRSSMAEYTGRICVIGNSLKKDPLKNLFCL